MNLNKKEQEKLESMELHLRTELLTVVFMIF